MQQIHRTLPKCYTSVLGHLEIRKHLFVIAGVSKTLARVVCCLSKVRISRYSSDTAFNTPTASTLHAMITGTTQERIIYNMVSRMIPAKNMQCARCYHAPHNIYYNTNYLWSAASGVTVKTECTFLSMSPPRHINRFKSSVGFCAPRWS